VSPEVRQSKLPRGEAQAEMIQITKFYKTYRVPHATMNPLVS